VYLSARTLSRFCSRRIHIFKHICQFSILISSRAYLFWRSNFLEVDKKMWSRYTPCSRFEWEELYLLLFLNLGTRRGVSGQHHAPAALYPGERGPGTHFIGGWVGPRADMDAETRRKMLCLCRRSNPGRPACTQTLYWLSYPAYAFWKYVNIVDNATSYCSKTSFILSFLTSSPVSQF
jgi:hypothetical protein